MHSISAEFACWVVYWDVTRYNKNQQKSFSGPHARTGVPLSLKQSTSILHVLQIGMGGLPTSWLGHNPMF